MTNKKFWIISILILIAVIISGWFIFTPSELNCSGSTPNKCNDQCWSNCSENQIFECDISGGMCSANPDNCPSNAPNSCNGECWACDEGQKFICDESLGGTCQKE